MHLVFLRSIQVTSAITTTKSHNPLLCSIRPPLTAQAPKWTVENDFNLRENENEIFSTLWFLSIEKRGQDGSTGGGHGKTSDGLLGRFPLTSPCWNAQTGWFRYWSLWERKMTPQISSDFGRSLQIVEIGDNLFTQSFPRILSNKGAAPSWWRSWWGKRDEKERTWTSYPLFPSSLLSP